MNKIASTYHINISDTPQYQTTKHETNLNWKKWKIKPLEIGYEASVGLNLPNTTPHLSRPNGKINEIHGTETNELYQMCTSLPN